MLFLQGTRDHRGSPGLLGPSVDSLPRGTLHVIEAADHAFQVQPESGRTAAAVIAELADCIADWARPLSRSKELKSCTAPD